MPNDISDRDALQADVDVRRHAREVCKLIAFNDCTDHSEATAIGPKCDSSNCFIWELIEMGRVGHPE